MLGRTLRRADEAQRSGHLILTVARNGRPLFHCDRELLSSPSMLSSTATIPVPVNRVTMKMEVYFLVDPR